MVDISVDFDIGHYKGRMAVDLLRGGKGLRLFRDGHMILSIGPHATTLNKRVPDPKGVGYVVFNPDMVPERYGYDPRYCPESRELIIFLMSPRGDPQAVLSVKIDDVDAVLPGRSI